MRGVQTKKRKFQFTVNQFNDETPHPTKKRREFTSSIPDGEERSNKKRWDFEVRTRSPNVETQSIKKERHFEVKSASYFKKQRGPTRPKQAPQRQCSLVCHNSSSSCDVDVPHSESEIEDDDSDLGKTDDSIEIGGDDDIGNDDVEEKLGNDVQHLHIDSVDDTYELSSVSTEYDHTVDEVIREVVVEKGLDTERNLAYLGAAFNRTYLSKLATSVDFAAHYLDDDLIVYPALNQSMFVFS